MGAYCLDNRIQAAKVSEPCILFTAHYYYNNRMSCVMSAYCLNNRIQAAKVSEPCIIS